MPNSDEMPVFTIDTDGVDVEKVTDIIRERVEKKRTAGLYDKYNLERITKLDVSGVKSDEDFLRYYLKIIRRTHLLNIDDFDIPSKGGIFGKPVVWLKIIIWNLLKFYTYRMFSQQTEFNLQLVHTLNAINRKIDRIQKELTQKLDGIKERDNGNKK